MANDPLVKIRTQTVITVEDELGQFEFFAVEPSDSEVLKGLTELIDHCWDDITAKDSTRYAVFALLCDHFALERTQDGRGDRLTRALFDGIVKE